MRILAIAILLVLGHPGPTYAAEEAKGRLGIRFEPLPEGALVVEVRPNGAAWDGGLRPGALLLEADGHALSGEMDQVRRRLGGAVGETVELVLRPPLSDERLTVALTRRVHDGRPPRDPSTRSPESRAFRRAVREQGACAVRRATRELVAAHPDGVGLGEEVGGGLRVAWRRRKALARVALEELRAAPLVDHVLLDAMAEVELAAGQSEVGLELLAQAQALAPPDIEGIDGWSADAGGRSRQRRTAISTLWELGRGAEAIEAARVLGRTMELPRLWEAMGMAPEAPATLWRGELGEPEAVVLPLLDGGVFRSAEALEEVVVLAFWATWCGPCEEELPELDAMWQRRGKDFRLVAVSIDQPGIEREVAAMARRLDLSMPVSHSPDAGRRFEVEALPTVVVLGRGGNERIRSRGYSEEGIDSLEAELGVVLQEQGLGAVLASARGPADLVGTTPLPGVRGLGLGPDGPLVMDASGRLHGLPEPGGLPTGWVAEAGSGAAADRFTWLEGPVVGRQGGHWLRGLDSLGLSRWVHGLPAALVDLDQQGEGIWVLMDGVLAVLDARGRVLHQGPTTLLELSSSEQGLLGLDPEGVHRLSLVGGELRRETLAPSSGGRALGEGGQVARGEVQGLLEGRFGAGGEARLLALREDGMLLGYDGQGQAVLRLDLAEVPRAAAVDLDGDGRDELLLLLRGKGLLVAALALP